MSIAARVARHAQTIDSLGMKLNHPDVYDSAEEFKADEARLLELHTESQPQGASVTCPALFRVSTGDGGSDIDVCGTYATSYIDSSVYCRAGHVTQGGPTREMY